MGILNVTPDSFYDGGRYFSEKNILLRAEKISREGATFIDIGGYSSRPGAPDVPEETESERVLPAIGAVHKNFPNLIISVDTFRSSIAQAAVGEGAQIINDISGGSLDPKMFSVVSRLRVPYIMMHMKGNPQTMNKESHYENLVPEIIDYFHPKINELTNSGVKDIIIDPGFGFAKTVSHNFELLSQLELLGILGKPMLVGLSRKSMVWRTLEIEPEEALNGSTALHTVALMKGASILRVHDVREAVQVVKLVGALNGKKPE